MYFRGFSEAPPPLEDTISPVRGIDPGGDRLPLDLLDDRRFEILAYQLKRAEFGNSARVSLMQGVGERGRDVVIYSADGNLLQIVQCKRLQDRMRAPALSAELLKLALHAYREPAIIGVGKIRYELWCPNGLTEPAAELLNRWPQSWTVAALTEPAVKLLKTTTRLSDVNWADASTFVADEFPRLVTPFMLENVDISTQVRSCSEVYRAYFEVKQVMDPLDVRSALREWASDLPAPGCETAADAAGVARRIEDLIGVPVEIALWDAGTLHLWMRGATPTRDVIRRDLLHVACVASNAPGVDEIIIGTIDTASFVGTVGGRGIGTVRVGFPAGATREVATNHRAPSEFWEGVHVYLMDPLTENTEAMRFARIPFPAFDRGGR